MTNQTFEDIQQAIAENHQTRMELEQMGYTTQICAVCYNPLCLGGYIHYEIIEDLLKELES